MVIDSDGKKSIDIDLNQSINITYEQHIKTSSKIITIDLTICVACDPLSPDPDPPGNKGLSLGVHAIDGSLKN